MTRSASRNGRDVACVLLAAGGSRRLGFPKQLVRRAARSLLAHALAAARGALPHSPLVVVLGAEALRLRLVVRRAAPSAIAVHNARWAAGLATSLNAGLRAVPASTRSILVTLVDQPNVDERALRRLLNAWRRRPGTAAAALYAGRPGVPAVLPRRYWRAIRTLNGDAGARALLRGTGITMVGMPEAELDIDTRADLARLLKGPLPAQPAVFVAQLTQPVAPLA
jgi:molybdenum cofactor cytidylyltransferase